MMTMQMVPLESITESKTNAATRGGDLAELVESVREHGVLQPVLVRPIGDNWELVAGHRRLAAAREVGLTEIPATVRVLSNAEALELQLIENLQRADLHPLEEAHGYVQLLRQNYDTAKIAARIGRSVAYVYDRLKLLALTKPAQKLFREGRFTAGHAVLLARLSPDAQARALDPENKAVFQEEITLLTPEEEDAAERAVDDDPVRWKPRSVRELQSWIDQHVRFDPAAKDVPDLFPETAVVVKAAKEDAEKVVAITHENYVAEEARTDERVIGPRSWRRAEKPCKSQVTGVIVIGPSRGKAFKVCINKDCGVHWAAEHREKARRAKASATGDPKEADRRKREEEKRAAKQVAENAQREQWQAGLPQIVQALATHVAGLTFSPDGPMATRILDGLDMHDVPKGADELLPRGDSAVSFVRHCVFLLLCADLCDRWSGPQAAADIKKAFGFDAVKVIQSVPAAEASPAKLAKKGGA